MEQQSCLPGVAEQQRGQDDRIPGEADGPPPDMSHVGVERLGPGDGQEDAAEHDEALPVMGRQEPEGVKRVDGEKHRGGTQDATDAEDRDDDEPEQHHRPEHLPDGGGAARLRGEEPQQDDERQRHHIGREGAGHHIDPLQRAENGDRRRDDAVAIDERGAEQPHADKSRRGAGAAAEPTGDEGHQRQNAAFAVIVRAHHEDAVFDRDRDDERPDDQGQQPEGRCRRRVAAHSIDNRLVSIERARTQIAIDDAHRRQ